jgi:Spherulation-specific family 4
VAIAIVKNAHWLRLMVTLVAALTLTLTGLSGTGALAAGPSTTAQRLAVPGYFYPGAEWTQLSTTAPAGSVVIVNPNSGPGATADPTYVSAINTARARGVKVIGYVATTYAARAPTVVKNEIDLYYQWYAMDGIFFDEGANACTSVQYYTDLTSYVRTKSDNTLAVSNPGTNIPSCFSNAADIFVNFESDAAKYLAETGWAPNAWESDPANGDRFWHLVYKTPQADLAAVMALTKQRNASWVYVTPDDLPNPWDTLPTGTYWSEEIAALAAPTPPNPTTTPTTPGSSSSATTTIAGTVPVESPTDVGSGFHPLTPTRILDTREGLGATIGKTKPDSVVRLSVASRGGVPGSGATAVTLNLTAVDPSGAGFVTVYPCGVDKPIVSNVNYAAGQTIANLVTVSMAADGTACITTSAPVHLLADIAGWYGSGGDGFHPVAPVRILDTRNAPAAKVGSNTAQAVRVAGRSEVPISGAKAVTLNVTIVDPQGAGFATVYPCDKAVPTASNVNFVAGQTIANLVTVPLAADGTVCIIPSSSAHVLADVAGWFGGPGDLFLPRSPERLLDTRNAIGATRGKHGVAAPLRLQVVSRTSRPGSPKAVTLNVTAVDPDGPGFVTVYPCDITRPIVSNLNYGQGQTIANLTTVPLAADGTVCISTSSPTHLLADIAGWYG